MPTVIPTLTETLDDHFTNTFYEIREDAIDQIMTSRVFWLWLKSKGRLVAQTGGRYIERTVRYALKSTQDIKKGSVLSQSEYQGKTVALWPWAYWAVDVTREFTEDQINAGPSKISDYVSDAIFAATEGAIEDLETKLFRWAQYSSTTTKQFQGLYDLVSPSSAKTGVAANSPTYNSGTFGGISRASNSWWRNLYQAGTNYETQLLNEWRNFFNDVRANLEGPDFILTNQTLYEIYEDEIADRAQIVRTSFDKIAADLGFDTLTFKGATVAYSTNVAGANSVYETLFLNSRTIEVVYDPNVWFDMTPWMQPVDSLDRAAYIVSTMQPICNEPRRNGYHVFTS